jgi:hypothetical protein
LIYLKINKLLSQILAKKLQEKLDKLYIGSIKNKFNKKGNFWCNLIALPEKIQLKMFKITKILIVQTL